MNQLNELLKALGRGLAALSPDCRTAVRLQSDALDRPLPWTRRFGLRVHLLLCKWCRRYGRQIAFLQTAAHEHPELLVGPGPHKLSPAARARICEKLREQRG